MQKKILVVEDSKVSRDYIKTSLHNAEFAVTDAVDGEDALEKIKKDNFDLIITDFIMPRMDGFQFCKLLRAKKEYASIPIILITSRGERVAHKFAEEISRLEYFVKPFEPSDLILRVKRILSLSEEKKILVIDDSNAVKKFIQNILSGKGYHIITASDGINGLEKLKKNIFDLIIVDFIMPRMDGFQFCKRLKQDERYKNIPVLVVSSKGERIGDKFINLLGITRYLTKPFTENDLVNTVNSFFPQRNKESESEYLKNKKIGALDEKRLRIKVELIIKEHLAKWEKNILEEIKQRENVIIEKIEQVSLTLSKHLEEYRG